MESFIYKVTPVGDGSLYGWSKYDQDGGLIEESVQNYPTEADAEKAARTLLTGEDRIEVKDIKNVNPEANRKVDLVVPPKDLDDRYRGMTPIAKGVDERAKDKKEAEDDKPRKSKKKASKKRR